MRIFSLFPFARLKAGTRVTFTCMLISDAFISLTRGEARRDGLGGDFAPLCRLRRCAYYKLALHKGGFPRIRSAAVKIKGSEMCGRRISLARFSRFLGPFLVSARAICLIGLKASRWLDNENAPNRQVLREGLQRLTQAAPTNYARGSCSCLRLFSSD